MNTVIFDMDGVLFDTEKVCMLSWDKAGEQMGIGKAGYMVMKTLGMNKESAIKVIQDEFGENFDAEEFKALGKKFSYEYFEKYGVPEKDGLYEILTYLKEKGYKIALASSTGSNSVFHHLREKNIEKYFDTVVCGDMIAKSKPEPDIYLKACEKLNENPADCYAVEDSRNGIISALSAGCKTIMIPDLWQGVTETDIRLFAKCKSLNELKKIL
ncbi:MAG: HAD family phosphatase [Acetobacter sp.]|nr:HAD family phosphatase [Bacteroides sp.]MCM1341760.1 HAD family phosphatase [Acetobacter sp.]MCM1433103.1 HAD family phosphatase [Clostridiales bacterium]